MEETARPSLFSKKKGVDLFDWWVQRSLNCLRPGPLGSALPLGHAVSLEWPGLRPAF